MVIEFLFDMIFGIIEGVVDLIPSVSNKIPSGLSEFISLISKGLVFFPPDLWIMIIGNMLFWTSAQFIWAIVEWCYKKLPGVD